MHNGVGYNSPNPRSDRGWGFSVVQYAREAYAPPRCRAKSGKQTRKTSQGYFRRPLSRLYIYVQRQRHADCAAYLQATLTTFSFPFFFHTIFTSRIRTCACVRTRACVYVCVCVTSWISERTLTCLMGFRKNDDYLIGFSKNYRETGSFNGNRQYVWIKKANDSRCGRVCVCDCEGNLILEIALMITIRHIFRHFLQLLKLLVNALKRRKNR